MYQINQYYKYIHPAIDILANGGCVCEEYNVLDYCPLFTPPAFTHYRILKIKTLVNSGVMDGFLILAEISLIYFYLR